MDAAPALFALAAGLSALWRSVGVVPDAVLGHSVGEIAAAHAAGVFGFEEGLLFAARRGALMGSLPRGGGMLAVFAGEDLVRAAAAATNERAEGAPLDLAADNGTHQVVSGPVELLAPLEEALAGKGVRAERLATSHAFHSGLMDPVLDGLEAAASQLALRLPAVPLLSGVTGREAGPGESRDPGYWRRQARAPVQFRSGVERLSELGPGVLLEVGPRGVLGPLAAMCWPSGEGPAAVVSQGGPETPGDRALCCAAGSAYDAGLDLSFAGFFGGERRRRVGIPGYPFQRERHWVRLRPPERSGAGHALLGERHGSASGEVVYEAEFSAESPEWLSDHRVFGRTVAPGALFGAQALAALRAEEDGPGDGVVEAVRIERPMVLPEGARAGRLVQVVLRAAEGSGYRRFEVFSRGEDEATWTLHARGRLGAAEGAGPERAETSLARLRATLTPVAVEEVYRRFADAGLDHGPAFRGLTRLWSGKTEALGEIELPEGLAGAGGDVHPALLDACFQLLGGVPDPGADDAERVWLPVGWERLRFAREAPGRMLCHLEVREAAGADLPDDGVRRADFRFFAADGSALGEVAGFRLGRAQRAALLLGSVPVADLLYRVEWRAAVRRPHLSDPEAPGNSRTPAEPAEATAVGTAGNPVRPEPGLWVVWPDSERARELVGALEGGGQQVVSPQGPAIPDSREGWREFFEGLPGSPPLRGVAYCGGLRGSEPDAGLPQAVEESLNGALMLAQGLSDAEVGAPATLCLLTRGGQVLDGDTGGELSGAALWGFGRAAARELGGVRVRLVDLDPDAEVSVAGLADELLFPDREPEVAFRGTERRVPRLARLTVSRRDEAEREPVRADRTYLVTGAFGALGLEAARWLAETGAGAVVLNGRREPEGKTAEAVARLSRSRTRIRVEVADVVEVEAVEGLLARIAASELPPLGGVVHCAAVLADRTLPNQDRESFARVLGPKVAGAWNLHRATRSLELELFVLFSSLAGMVGSPGQSNYASANAFLDQLAVFRRNRGLPGQAIAWGAWSDAGIAEAARDRLAGRLRDAGSGWMTPEQGVAALARLVREDVGASLVAPFDWAAVAAIESPPLLEDLAPDTPGPRAPSGDLTARLRASSDPDALLIGFLRERVQSVLRLSELPAPDTGFFDLGMDSLTAVELGNQLQRALGDEVAVPNTAVFDYPDINRLARRLRELLGGLPKAMAASPPAVGLGAGEERVAIVGMAGRLPGASDLAGFGARLLAGDDLVTEGRPDDLMPDLEGTERPPWGAYVSGLDRFDAEFFRIAPIEAELMDPQQRMLLETSWEALEDAGLDPGTLHGSRTGVYVGIMNRDYEQFLPSAGTDPHRMVYLTTGSGFAAAIGRISFVFGFQGPAIAVDTACSSSLVAIHQAAAALQRGEADLALAGGVNAILMAAMTRASMAAGMLSPDGRCRTFDAAANGYVRGEGCGMLVLKRLSDAQRDGDRILGVVLGSAVNQDGASAGLTVPNGPAQEQVIREALFRAEIAPSSVDYLEAHGTGTELGDPIEVQAAAAVYGEGRDGDVPLLLGSVKTNIGHLESAAGVAGVIKVLLAMREGVIPRHLHFERPNPRLDWVSLPVRVTAEAVPWPVNPERPFRAGVSSFGYSGTNAHLVLEGYGQPGEERGAAVAVGAPPVLPAEDSGRGRPPEAAAGELAERRFRVLPLSARTPRALSELAGRYLEWLGEGEGAVSAERLADGAWTAGTGRRHFRERAGLVFSGVGELREQLEALAAGGLGSSSRAAGKVAFLFTGQGSQWPGMGRELYEREPVFREVLDRAEAVIREERRASLLGVMFGAPGDGAPAQLDATEWTQPALFALAAGLSALWRSVGVVPDAVLGHSVGEIAAAHAAGVFGFEEGLLFAARRGALMGSLPRKGRGSGQMLAVFASTEVVRAAARETSEGARGVLELAAENGTHQVVSGPPGLVSRLVRRLRARGIRVERLETSHAFHSAQMDRVLDRLEDAASKLSFAAAAVPLVAGVTGRVSDAGECGEPGFWRRQARAPVRFGTGVRALAEFGAGVLVEIGPRAVLGPMAALSWPEREAAGPLVVASQPGAGAPADLGFGRAVSEAWNAGLDVRFAGLFAGEDRRRASLPAYPFQRKRHWLKPGRRPGFGRVHPLLGDRSDSATGEVRFEAEFSVESPAWLSEHRVFGRAVAPGALYGVQALAAFRALGPAANLAFVRDVEIERPLVLDGAGPDAAGRTVQVVLREADGAAARRVEVFSRGGPEEAWIRHAKGAVGALPVHGAADSPAPDVPRLRSELSPAPADALYARLADAGLAYGPAFRAVRRLWTGTGQALAELKVPDGLDLGESAVHPVLLDACFQVLAGMDPAHPGEAEGAWLPVGWEQLWLGRTLPERIFCHARIEAADAGGAGKRRASQRAELRFASEDGEVLGGVRGFRLRRADRGAFFSAAAAVDDLLYGLEWRKASSAAGAEPIPADFITGPEELAGAVERWANGGADEAADEERMDALALGMEEVARAHVLRAFAALGWAGKTGDEFAPEALRRRLGVVEAHTRLFGRLLAILGETGVLAPGDPEAGWKVVVGSDDPPPARLGDPEERAKLLLERHPEGSVEISLLDRCGTALAEVLRGRAEGLDLLFSGEGSVETLYRESPGQQAVNRFVADAVAAAVGRLPEGRRLRVLEVGAGTGGTTWAVLPRLPEGRTDYTYTDVSAGFLRQAQERLGPAGSNLKFRRLDIERDPEEQGLDPYRYDLVLAANVLHATRDLGDSLRNCRRLLAPSGLLLALESMQRQAWLDLVFGLVPGWWRFDDRYRTDHALIPPATWRAALADAGFPASAVLGFKAAGFAVSESESAPAPPAGVVLGRAPRRAEPEPGLWVLAPGSASAPRTAGLVRELEAHGQVVLVHGPAAGPEAAHPLLPPSRESWRDLFSALPESPPLRGVVHLDGIVEPRTEETGEGLSGLLERICESALTLSQGLYDAGASPARGLFLVTRNGQVVRDETVGEPAASVLWGFGRSLAWEFGGMPVRLLDLDPAAELPAFRLADQLLFGDRETEAAWRDGERWVPRLVRLPANPGAAAPERLRSDRTYLITGGLGGIGLRVARWLCEQGAGAVVLNGRRPPEAGAAEAVDNLRTSGFEVRVEVADVSDLGAVEAMLAKIRSSGLPPLGGVIHSVGALADRSLPNQDRESFAAVLGPKTLGAWNLHRATLDSSLDLFVLFSSFAGWVGNLGQANHAAANAFLDQLARWRRARGLPGQAIAWGAWAQLGEAAEARDRVAARFAVGGMGWMAPEPALAAMSRVVRQDVVTSAVASVDWQAADPAAAPPAVAELVSAPSAEEEAFADVELWSRLVEVRTADRERLLATFLGEQVQAVLRLPAPPAPEIGFFELGMDSLVAVDLRNRVYRALGGQVPVPNTVVFDYPDIQRLARYLAGEIAGGPVRAPAAPRVAPLARPDDRIAVIGMGGRLPGGADLSAFWSRLLAGDDLVTAGRPDALMPDLEEGERPPYGAYVSGLDRFDPEFFRIAPVEAELMDPQQRMLLEASWEALEDAGLDPESLRGSRTGVYVGIMNRDYEEFLRFAELEPGRGAYLTTGAGPAATIGRVSFSLGFQGPAIAVDTACSSSLVAIHQAAVALARGEADLALAGGVNAILLASVSRAPTAAGMLSPEGRCKTFDAEANGFVRGEGCGLLALKRLSDAERDGDRILGVLLGSAVNQDGASAGLTVPNGPAQEQVIREALDRSGVEAASVDYLECHGTGTELGDPIEVQAAAAVYGAGRATGRPLLLGSVKTNIGHLESAAGVAGVIKVLLAMQEGVIPRHLHFERPNLRLDWGSLPVRVTSEATPWPVDPARPFRAAVSSFGYSGTNAHLVLEGGPVPAKDSAATELAPLPGAAEPHRLPVAREVRLLPLSARTPAALSELAARYLDWFDDGGNEPSRAQLAAAAWTAGTGRRHFRERAGLVFTGPAELREQLRALAAGRGPGQKPVPGKVAFVFTGQGSQWVGMGRDLYEREPVVRRVLDQADTALRDERGGSLVEVMFGSGAESGDLNRTEWAQPALYALQAALVAQWRSVGIEPEVVLGHSVGEIAAAYAAGVFGLEEGLRFAARRGALMGSLPRTGKRAGGMLAVFAPLEDVTAVLREADARDAAGERLDLAAENGTHQVVSGPRGLLSAFASKFRRAGVRVQRIRTSHAFHSGLMAPVLDELERAAGGLAASKPAIPLVSNVTGRVAGAAELADGAYWRRQARSTVRFGAGVRTVSDLDVGVLVEIGPRAVLAPLAALCWPAGDVPAPQPIASQEGEETRGDLSFARAVSQAYEAGLPVDFAGFHAEEPARRIALPKYPFQRQRYWLEPKRRRLGPGHPLLGVRRESGSGEVVFENELSAASPGWLSDHRVFGRVLAPGALFGAQALAALRLEGGGPGAGVVEECRIERPLVLPEGEGAGRVVQLVLHAAEGSALRRFEVCSRAEEGEPWIVHARGRVGAGERSAPGLAARTRSRLRRTLKPVTGEAVYDRLAAAGLDYGPAFRGLVRVWSGAREALGEIELPEGLSGTGGNIHPALLDACFQLLGGVAYSDQDASELGGAFIGVGWEEVWLAEARSDRLLCRAQFRDAAPATGGPAPELLKADFGLYREDGTAVGGIKGFAVRRTSRSGVAATSGSVSDLLYEVEWRAIPGRTQPGLLSADLLAGPAAVASGVRRTARRLLEEVPALAGAGALAEGLEGLARAYALAALDQLGFRRERGETVSIEELMPRLKVVDQHRRLLGRMLGMLEEAGVLSSAGRESGWVVVSDSGRPLPGSPAEPEALADELIGRHPEGAVEVGLLRRCGAALSEVLRGRADGLDLLFSGEPNAAALYRDAPSYRAMNRIVADAIGGTIAGLPEGRRLRVLEVGAGTGGTTGAVLSVLPAGRTDFTYTDISPGFFRGAEDRFGGGSVEMDYRVLDIGRDPAEQGFDLHRYDLVLAANVLHATRDLGQSLGNCRRLLAPAGVLVALEVVEAQGWLDLTFGLLADWWGFDDAYRTDHPFVAPSTWARALSDAGYPEAAWIGTGGPEANGGAAGEPELPGAGGATLFLARGPEAVAPVSGAWVVWPASAEGTIGDELAKELESRGQSVLCPGAGGSASPFDPEDREAWRGLFSNLPRDAPLRGVVHLGAFPGDEGEAVPKAFRERVERNAASALALVQGLFDSGKVPAGGLWFVTRGGQILEREQDGDLAGAVLWGFGKVLTRELADFGVRMVDLDPEASVSAGSLALELLFPDRENHVAFRRGVRLVARLARRPTSGTPAPETGNASPPVALREGRLSKDRTYLVTGGLTGLGLRTAEWLAARGAGAIVLNGRRAPGPPAEDVIRRIRAAGTKVRVERGDVAEAPTVERLLGCCEGPGATLPRLGGVIHAAAVFRDAAVVNYGWAQVRRILWPKVIGAWRLHRATRDLDLDFFVLFSSSSGVIGNTGQAAYGAANAFLDQLAGYRRALGLAGQAIAWGVWSDVGVAEGYRAPFEERLEKIGLGWFAPEAGFQALERLLREGAARSMFARVDWPVFVGAARGDQPLIGHLVGDSAAAGVSAGAAPGTLPARLDAVSGTEREALLVGFVQREVQSALRLALPPSPEVGFFDLGVDSVMAVELRNRLNRALGERYVLPNTAIFDYPTVAELAGHLAGQLSARPGTTGEFRTAPAGRTAEDPVAVVGMACRFPGSPDLAAFRNALRDGGNPVTRGRPDGLGGNGADPEDRPWGAYLADLDRFDPEFFRIAPVEAEFMDPQQRLLLENSWHALEEAGIAPVTLRGSRTGLYFGVAASSYAQMIQTQSLHAVTGNSTAAAVGRIAFTLGFRGPAIAVDTACSSSLVAIHQAVLGLIAGDADLALAGGVNTILSEESTRLLGTGLMLSENGRCRTFDAGADGIVRGEGCGVVVLKRLEDAERDGDRILGVVVGSAVNQDGASAGLTVPNGPAQEQVIRDALRRARIPATGVDYLEAHGTGTELGDPIELQAAAAVYGEGREPERPLLIGSVKTNIGHAETAAGVAGVIKVLLAMREGVIPKHLHFERPNPRMDWKRLPVRVTSEATAWPAGLERPVRAGVSSFGISGTNAHLILEAHGRSGEDAGAPVVVGAAPVLPVGGAGRHRPPEAGEMQLAERRFRVLPLSGRSVGALAETAGRYREWLNEDSGERSAEGLANASWTAGVGRNHFSERAGVVFSSSSELSEQLALLGSTGTGPGVGATRERLRSCSRDRGGSGRGWAGSCIGGSRCSGSRSNGRKR